MNFTEYALKNKALVYFFVVVLIVGGDLFVYNDE